MFDLLHIGHIRHFQAARKRGEILVVTVTPDRYVNKGPHRPVFTEMLRAEAIAALDGVNYVAINKWPTPSRQSSCFAPMSTPRVPTTPTRPADHTGGIARERHAVEGVGGSLVFTDEITFSSSIAAQPAHVDLLEGGERLPRRSSGASSPSSDVTGYIARAQALRVLVVGEAIIDEYHYCETLGKSGKEPILAAQFVRCEKFVGGSLAVANHVASCCGTVRLVTMLGSQDSHEDLIRDDARAGRHAGLPLSWTRRRPSSSAGSSRPIRFRSCSRST